MNQTISVGLLESLGQEETLLHVVVGGIGGVDVLHTGETSTDPAVLINGLDDRRQKKGKCE